MRCFVAIDIDEGIKAGIADLQKRLRAEVQLDRRDVKWVSPETIHLTLKFLGEVKDKELVGVCKAVEKVCCEYGGFDVEVGSVGTFGKRYPTVVWVGVKDSEGVLVKLAKDIDVELGELGFSEERREYSGHLTVCRIKNASAGGQLLQATKNYSDIEMGFLAVGSVAVYESQLTSEGPVYTKMGSYKLK